MMQTHLRCLVSGAGIAGTSAAFWLARAGHSVTIVERAPNLRKEGQTIDICGEAEEVVRRMGLLQACKDRHTGEDRLLLVDQHNRTWGNLPFRRDDQSGFSPLHEIEIVRGELAQILWNATKDKISSRFGTTIEAIEHGERGSSVTLSDGSKEAWDVVLVCEGLYSRTRALAFDEEITKAVRSLGVYNIIYSIPRISSDDMAVRWCPFPSRRGILIRADKSDRLFVGLTIRDPDAEFAQLIDSRAPADQIKQATLQRFEDLQWTGWSDRLMDGLRTAEDIYPAVVGQARNERWSIGQTVLVGDCAYAPSLYSGGGTHMAIVGAYILAANLHDAWCDNPEAPDVKAALKKYEDHFKPVMQSAQDAVASWAPKLQLQDSALGNRAFNLAAYTVSVISAVSTWRISELVFGALGAIGNFLPERDDRTPRIKLPRLETFDRLPL